MERDFKGVWVPKDIYLNDNLTPTEKFLLVEIDSLSKNGECFASNAHFAEFLKVTKNHVSKLISKLSRMGLIQVEFIYKTGTKEVEKRIITPLIMEEYTPNHAGVDPLITEEYTPLIIDDYCINTSFNNPIKNTTKVLKNNIKSFENEFDELWKIYPKKQNREKAKQSFLKARKNNVSLETIERGLTNYVNYIELNDIEPQFIKHGATWFNGQCWNDDYNLQLRKKERNGFLGLYLDELEEQRRGNIYDYRGTYKENFSDITSSISESLQEF